MANPVDISNLPAYDANSLNSLKRLSSDNSPEALKAAAQQFEAVFLGMVLKSMRDATPQDGMMDSEQTRAFQSMLDQQLAQTLAAKGSTGLADVLVKQFSQGAQPPQESSPPLVTSYPASSAYKTSPLARADVSAAVQEVSMKEGGARAVSELGNADPSHFVNKLWPHALKASQSAGVPAHFMIAQAALETGWGKSEMLRANGQSAHNLFGVKAGRDWAGPVVEQTTTEYVDGVAQKVVARFRAYESYEEAFSDYAKLLKNNPRYSAVMGNQDAAGFARGLQQAGYATDPMYAAKLERIITGPSLRRYLQG